MASLPARRPSQRRASPPETSNRTASHPSQPSPVRSRSEDSQTIFVSQPDDELQQQEQAEVEAEEEPILSPERPYNIADDPNVNRCWICFSDSTEDTAETSPWRDPCPCALVAHEDCLLDWIADKEAPKNNRGGPIAAPKIECPQCKTEIKLARPRDYVVDAVRAMERLGGRLMIPGSVAFLGSGLYHISMATGMHSIYAVFGADDGYRILQPMIYEATRAPVYAVDPRDATEQILRLLVDRMVHWRLYIGLPLITPIVVLSRTSYADGILPILPIVFFASQAHSPDQVIDFAQWPPSAGFSFAILPYLRALYNAYYQRVWAEHEKRWLKEIQPRNGQGEAEEPAAVVIEEWNDDDAQQVAGDAAVIPPQEQDEAAPAPVIPDNREPNQAPHQPQPNQQADIQRRLTISPTSIAETVIGAFLFPTIAGLSGEALKLVLPTARTTPPPSKFLSQYSGVKSWPKGFLQSKWARSLVGGCLFVVCKDALMIYVRWKMAQMHRNRRVVDIDRRKLERERAGAPT